MKKKQQTENKLLLGAHVSIAGGIEKSLLRGYDLGCSTIQIFTKSSRGWREKELEKLEIDNFHKNKMETGIDPVISHCSYLINLASPEEETYRKSINAMLREMERCTLLDIKYLVMHPGSHKGSGEISGIEKITDTINLIHQKTAGFIVKILLEITAGQGTSLGYKLEHITKIIEGIEEKSRIGFCLDTAHAFAAGYELRTKQSYGKLFRDIKEIAGMESLMAIHLNDSKSNCGSRVDRHEHIGRGKIGEEPFRWIMKDKRLKNIPKIIETPNTIKKDRENLKLLKSYCDD